MTLADEPKRLTQIPFLSRFVAPILADPQVKDMTLRGRAYGEIGEQLEATSGGIPFAIVQITDLRTSTPAIVGRNYWKREGCISQADFEQVWRDIHPHVPPSSDRTYRLHTFKRISVVRRAA